MILSFLRLNPSTTFWTLVDYDGYSISSKGFLPTVVDIMVLRYFRYLRIGNYVKPIKLVDSIITLKLPNAFSASIDIIK